MSILDVAPELQLRVRDRVEEVSRALGIYVRRLDISYDIRTATLYGTATYGWKGLIRLNPAYLNTHPEWYLEHVVAHEYCHLAVERRHGPRAQAHGPEWRTLMEAAGVAPERCYSVDLPDWVEVGPRQRVIGVSKRV